MKYLILIGLLPFAVWAGANTSDWENSLKGIASGEQAWLAKVPQLAARADVQQATRMEDALASALAKNTPGVLETLRVIDARSWPHMAGTDIVCSVPAEQPTAFIKDFYQQTRLALLATDQGATCLWILEASYEEMKAESARMRNLSPSVK